MNNKMVTQKYNSKLARGFTLIEVLVVIGIMAVLIGLLLPAAEHVRHQGYIDKCASNLRQIGLAISTYEIDNHGNYPRTVYDVATADNPVSGTGNNPADPKAIDPFIANSSVKPNDLTAPLFLVMKLEKIGTEVMICPYNDDTSYVADKADITGRSNFTDQSKNLGYSFANPYPNASAALNGYRLSSKMSSEFAIGADRNPGTNGKNDDVYAPTLGAATSVMEKGNSDNHEKDGQNVLYADGHVEWRKTPFAGIQQDNIYTAKNKTKPAAVEASPADANDSVLLPAEN